MKTQFDLWKSAVAAAQDSLEITDGHKLATFVLERFNKEKQAPADYEQWIQFFNQLRPMMVNHKSKPAPSSPKKQ